MAKPLIDFKRLSKKSIGTDLKVGAVVYGASLAYGFLEGFTYQPRVYDFPQDQTLLGTGLAAMLYTSINGIMVSGWVTQKFPPVAQYVTAAGAGLGGLIAGHYAAKEVYEFGHGLGRGTRKAISSIDSAVCGLEDATERLYSALENGAEAVSSAIASAPHFLEQAYNSATHTMAAAGHTFTALAQRFDDAVLLAGTFYAAHSQAIDSIIPHIHRSV